MRGALRKRKVAEVEACLDAGAGFASAVFEGFDEPAREYGIAHCDFAESLDRDLAALH